MSKTLEELQRLVFLEYCEHGFMHKFNDAGEIGDVAELGLITTEVSEVIEAVRKNQDNVGEECADIIIRTLNFMTRKGLHADLEIMKKNVINEERAFMHGKKV